MTDRLSQSELETYLWGAATILRGLVDAGDYKQIIFPLLFYKRLSDVWDEEYQEALAETDDPDYARAMADERFTIPAGAHWQDVRETPKDVGRALQTALRAIEAANPARLEGVFGDAPWTNKERLPDRHPQEPAGALLPAHPLDCQRARGRAGQRLRVPDQAVRR